MGLAPLYLGVTPKADTVMLYPGPLIRSHLMGAQS